MKKRSFRIYLILTLFWTAGIFLHSAMPAAASNAESGGVLAVVQMILPWITHGVLRKAAHFLEFAVLGILLTGTFHSARNFTLAKPMLFAVLTAMTDETIQAFTPGRNCALSDVWLDAAGALTGAVLLWLIFKLRKNKAVLRVLACIFPDIGYNGQIRKLRKEGLFPCAIAAKKKKKSFTSPRRSIIPRISSTSATPTAP